VLRGSYDIKRDDGNIDGNGDAGLRRLLLRVRRFGRDRILLLLRRRGAALRTGGSLSDEGLLGQGQKHCSRGGGQQNSRKNGLHKAPLNGDQKNAKLAMAAAAENTAAKELLNLSNGMALPKPRAHTCMLV
jgi:hypothetical protein